MSNRLSAGWNIVLSLLFYAIGSPLLTAFVSPNGISGVLFAYPLYCFTWLFGKKRGFVAAATGLALNSAVWFVLGDGIQTISRSGTVYIATLYLVQCLAFGVFVVIVGNTRQREEQKHEEIERSRDLLRLSEMKYRNLIEAAPEAISVLENGKVIFCNSHLLEMLGYTREEMMGMDISQIVFKDDLGRAKDRYAARAQGEVIPKAIFRDVKKNGEMIWVESIGQRVELDGRPVVLYFTSDVTERTRSEEALQRSEEKYRVAESKYRNLIEVAPEAISVVENGKVTFCNSQGLDMLGYSQEEMIGMDFTRLLHENNVAECKERYWGRTEDGAASQSTPCLVKKNGELMWVKSVGKLIDWEGRRAVLNFTSDVTEQKRLEEQFAQAQKMEAIGRLAGGIAHDFNNVLQVILGFCSMAKSYPDDKTAILNDIRVIEEAGQKAASLTQQLLAFSRKQVVQTKVFDLRELVQQSKKILGRVLGEDVTISVAQSGEECRVRADTGQLEQVIMNLALNARDAMPEGGTITVSVGTLSLQKSIGNEIPPGDYVALTVNDTGHGIDESTMDHLFEPFFTTKEPGKGTGLGLSIIYGIVKQNAGHIQVGSKVGHGSTFTVYLPRVFEAADSSTGSVEKESLRGSGSVLLVEDEASVRSLATKMLEQGGYTVTTAASGEEAMAVCRSTQRGFDLLLTDIVLTGMRGGKVAESARRFFPAMRVIYMTGYVDRADLPKHDGAQILLKPFSAEELLAQAKKALSSATWHSPA